MEETITGKVAAVIDDSTLVLNVGRAHGVREGMVFVVFGEHDDILDPETGESLGRWESVKARVVVTHVQDRMCTVRSPLVREAQVTDGTRPLSTLMVEHSMGHYGEQSRPWRRMDVRAADMLGRPQAQPIGVGDGARSVPLESQSSASTSVADTDSSGAEPPSADVAID